MWRRGIFAGESDDRGIGVQYGSGGDCGDGDLSDAELALSLQPSGEPDRAKSAPSGWGALDSGRHPTGVVNQ